MSFMKFSWVTNIILLLIFSPQPFSKVKTVLCPQAVHKLSSQDKKQEAGWIAPLHSDHNNIDGDKVKNSSS